MKLFTSCRKCPVWILVRTTTTCDFIVVFLISLGKFKGKFKGSPQSDHDYCISNPFQFINHQSPYKLCCTCTVSNSDYKMNYERELWWNVFQSVHMYVCLCVHMCVHTHTHTHLHVFTCMHKANMSTILHYQSINPTTTMTPYISTFIWNASNIKVARCAKITCWRPSQNISQMILCCCNGITSQIKP